MIFVNSNTTVLTTGNVSQKGKNHPAVSIPLIFTLFVSYVTYPISCDRQCRSASVSHGFSVSMPCFILRFARTACTVLITLRNARTTASSEYTTPDSLSITIRSQKSAHSLAFMSVSDVFALPDCVFSDAYMKCNSRLHT